MSFIDKIKNFKFKTAVIFALVFVGLLIFVLVYESGREVKEGEIGLETFTVWELDKEELNKVVFNYNDEKLTLTKKDDGWKGKRKPKDENDKPEEFKVDQSKLDLVLDTLIKIEANDEINGELKDFGLTEPKIKTVFFLKDDKKKELILGDKNPEGTNFYAKINGEDYIFLVPTSVKAKMETREEDIKEEKKEEEKKEGE